MFKTVGSLIALYSSVMLAVISPSTASAGPPSGRIAIVNAHSGLCLSPAGGNRQKNDEIVQFTCDRDPSRFWSFTVVSGNTVEITNANSGLCLTVAGGNTERNTAAVQYTCDGDPSRRWNYIAVDEMKFRLKNVHSGLCLTVAGGGTGKNVTAVQFPCDGDPSRDWKVTRGQAID